MSSCDRSSKLRILGAVEKNAQLTDARVATCLCDATTRNVDKAFNAQI
jgi:hypothetical protein